MEDQEYTEQEQVQDEAQEQDVEQELEAQEAQETEETGEQQEQVPPTKTVPLKALEEERRKRQELENRLREQEQARPTEQQKTIYDYYEENPKAVIDYLNGEIARLSQEDPFGSAGQIEALRDQKVELRAWAEGRKREKENKFNAAISDLARDREGIAKFAVEQLGYTPAEYATLTDPLKVGESMAVKNLKLIKKQYDAANAGATVKNKEVRKQPNPVESSTGEVKRPNNQLQKLKDQAMRTGSVTDWAAYLDAGGT